MLLFFFLKKQQHLSNAFSSWRAPCSLTSFIFTFVCAATYKLHSAPKLKASKICSHTHTHLWEETDKSEPLKPRHAQSEEIQKSESSESAAQSQHRSQQRAYLLLTKASELKSELKLCSKRLLCSTSLKLLFKLKGVDWLRAMTTESPHHSHKFASSKPHPAREREGGKEREGGREGVTQQKGKHWSFP